jgi:hypothetical protein
MESGPHDVPDVYILSARFGLIRGDEPIPLYDRRMTPQLAEDMRKITSNKLQKLDPGRRYQCVFLSAGAAYREILSSPILAALPPERLVASTGSQGVQLAQMKSWLYQDTAPSAVHEPHISGNKAPMQFKLRGTEYEIAPAEAITVARRSLKNGSMKGLKPTAWYVLVDGQRIPPKWLLSQLTGMSVGDFHSIEARRVLAQLGMFVRQV